MKELGCQPGADEEDEARDGRSREFVGIPLCVETGRGVGEPSEDDAFVGEKLGSRICPAMHVNDTTESLLSLQDPVMG